MSVAEIHSRLQSEAERREIADNWILEELMLPLDGSEAPIDDFKVYAFYGRAELILQKANFSLKGWRRARYRWYDRNWRPIETGKHDERIGNDLRPPSNRAELISAVEAWSSRIPYPFMRIDAYNASRGIVCGELTACPGNRERFNAPTSRRLAEAWFDADARLKADLGERSPH